MRQLVSSCSRRLVLLLAVLALFGCSSAQPAPPATPQAGDEQAAAALAIDCHVAYRSSVTLDIERSGDLPLTKDEGERTVTFNDLEFFAQYWDEEFESRALRIAVRTVETGNELVAQLYQMDRTKPLINQFPGDHGFTGLGYVYHPESGAELQYWCTAR